MGLDQLTHDVQPEPESVAARPLARDQRMQVEQMRQHLGGNAALVAHPDSHLAVACAVELDLHAAAVAVLERIAEQVRQHLCEACAVPAAVEAAARRQLDHAPRASALELVGLGGHAGAAARQLVLLALEQLRLFLELGVGLLQLLALALRLLQQLCDAVAVERGTYRDRDHFRAALQHRLAEQPVAARERGRGGAAQPVAGEVAQRRDDQQRGGSAEQRRQRPRQTFARRGATSAFVTGTRREAAGRKKSGCAARSRCAAAPYRPRSWGAVRHCTEAQPGASCPLSARRAGCARAG